MKDEWITHNAICSPESFQISHDFQKAALEAQFSNIFRFSTSEKTAGEAKRCQIFDILAAFHHVCTFIFMHTVHVIFQD